ncbi:MULTISPECIES: IS66 family insertion sequence element accessory protein TnpB [Burkholderiaceae]|jgi:transposase|uniref:Mobile element protein n=1 Tax=Caballeronia sordidicola TaxID=196367 RepID=A0A242N6G8_CABSO|nr:MULTISPECIES: IS66 family insertion sequence element accessory protein TnpB [Burkholderiaceae]AME27277.1 transposase [Burkholderia sp. PAMC 26561]AME27572.1 transposase [Burkholderia sp. PAMC 26561]OTP79257.1 Mobile element protein [Caballeronia sordidicola]
MFRFDEDLKVFLHRDAIDGRKGINGLVALVEQALKLDPFAPAVYAFTNKRRDRVKLILWNRTGFWLLIKRLEADRFAWPREAAVLELTVEQLHWLLDGVDLAAMKKHSARHYMRAS